MKFKVDLHLKAEQIAYVFCWHYKKNDQWPKTRKAMYSTIREYLAEFGEPRADKVEDALNGMPNLMAMAMSTVEDYFPYSFD